MSNRDTPHESSGHTGSLIIRVRTGWLVRESSEGVRAPPVVAGAGAAGGVGAVGVATVGTYVMQREGERVRPLRQDTGFRDGDGAGGAVARVGVGVGGVGVVGVGCFGCMHRDRVWETFVRDCALSRGDCNLR